MPADIRNSTWNGAGDHRRWRTGAAARGRRRGGFRGRWRARFAASRRIARRCGRGDRCEWRDRLRARRACVCAAAGRRHRRGDFEFTLAGGAQGAHLHLARHRAGGDRRFHANEGRDGAEDGPEYAFYCRDGAARSSLRELDGSRGADKSEVAATRRADPGGSGGRKPVHCGTRSASGGPQSAVCAGHAQDRSQRARCAATAGGCRRSPPACPAAEERLPDRSTT